MQVRDERVAGTNAVARQLQVLAWRPPRPYRPPSQCLCAVALSSCCRELRALGVTARRRHLCCAACGHALCDAAQALTSETHREAPALRLPDGESMALDPLHCTGCRLSEEQPLEALETLLYLRASWALFCSAACWELPASSHQCSSYRTEGLVGSGRWCLGAPHLEPVHCSPTTSNPLNHAGGDGPAPCGQRQLRGQGAAGAVRRLRPAPRAAPGAAGLAARGHGATLHQVGRACADRLHTGLAAGCMAPVRAYCAWGQRHHFAHVDEACRQPDAPHFNPWPSGASDPAAAAGTGGSCSCWAPRSWPAHTCASAGRMARRSTWAAPRPRQRCTYARPPAARWSSREAAARHCLSSAPC